MCTHHAIVMHNHKPQGQNEKESYGSVQPPLTLNRCTASSYSKRPLTPLICSVQAADKQHVHGFQHMTALSAHPHMAVLSWRPHPVTAHSLCRPGYYGVLHETP